MQSTFSRLQTTLYMLRYAIPCYTQDNQATETIKEGQARILVREEAQDILYTCKRPLAKPHDPTVEPAGNRRQTLKPRRREKTKERRKGNRYHIHQWYSIHDIKTQIPALTSHLIQCRPRRRVSQSYMSLFSFKLATQKPQVSHSSLSTQ
jgi:hypothetical protein